MVRAVKPSAGAIAPVIIAIRKTESLRMRSQRHTEAFSSMAGQKPESFAQSVPKNTGIS